MKSLREQIYTKYNDLDGQPQMDPCNSMVLKEDFPNWIARPGLSFTRFLDDLD